MNAPANLGAQLPALIDALPSDATRAPQTQFDRARQVAFLEALAVGGSVRSAASRARVSHQSVYRARRAVPAFRRAWDAALVVARGRGEAVLAERAIEGIEEDVWYHGEVVGTRRRYDARLLLAHLGRLDRLEADQRTAGLAEHFEGLLDRMRAGAEVADAVERHTSSVRPELVEGLHFTSNATPEERAGVGTSSPLRVRQAQYERGEGDEIPSPGQCNTRSMSPDAAACCDAPRWPQCRDCPQFPPVERLLCEMDEQRPGNAPPIEELGDRDMAEQCQMEAFEAQDPEWWRYGEGFELYEPDGYGGWRVVRGREEE